MFTTICTTSVQATGQWSLSNYPGKLQYDLCKWGTIERATSSTSHLHAEDQVGLTSGSKVDSQTVQYCPTVL